MDTSNLEAQVACLTAKLIEVLTSPRKVSDYLQCPFLGPVLQWHGVFGVVIVQLHRMSAHARSDEVRTSYVGFVVEWVTL